MALEGACVLSREREAARIALYEKVLQLMELCSYPYSPAAEPFDPYNLRNLWI
jgi:hypothetical protein